jgi:outer membrane protein
MNKLFCLLSIILIWIYPSPLYSQTRADSLLTLASLPNCIQYALNHQPSLRQSRIDEQIIDREIKSQLSEWYPQLNLTANYQDNFQLPTTKFADQLIKIGTYNTSAAQFALTQTIFNRDVLIARSTAKDVRNQSKQITTNKTIDLVANVSKAFYDVLLSRKQIELVNEDIVLLERSLKDAYNQYKGGIVDKTDYQRATISLNNAKAQRKTSEEQLKGKYATLKLLISYPAVHELDLVYDSMQLAKEILMVDTLQDVNFNNRIEYQLLSTQKRLEEANVKYYKWGYLPSVSAFGQYNFNYLNDEFSKLYGQNFPISYAGLTFSLPIFQGTKRVQQIKIAQLQLARLDYEFTALKDSINTQYTQALALYKANLSNYYIQRDNLELAKDVYNIIQLQYRSGVKTYLEVITANTDLFSAEINYANAAFQVLSNKIDVERALGTLQF